MQALIPTIGLEVHCQLRTATKMFCACSVSHGEPPNTQVCPVCLGHPGALPVVNDEAVQLGVIAGFSLGCTVHETSIFSRKHYFYPDLPKGYQISQFDRPLCTQGSIHVEMGGERRRFGIHRIHLEEDAGKLRHDGDVSRVDWNRCGTPLIEVVGDPDLHAPEEAEAWLRMLHRVVIEAGVCTGDMEKGHFRCDANVSVAPADGPLGTRVEVKNINSFRFVSKAIRSEIARQKAVLAEGGHLVQETRSWTGRDTVSLRSKEEAADYRYFPDPDLGPLRVTNADRDRATAELSGVPLDRWLLDADAETRSQFALQTGLGREDVAVILSDEVVQTFFLAAVSLGGDAQSMANWLRGPVARWLNEADSVLADTALTPRHLVDLEALISGGTITRTTARDLLGRLARDGGDPVGMVEEQGLVQIDDSAAITAEVAAIVADNSDAVDRYRAGQSGLLGFFMGEAMRRFSGRADPQQVRAAVLAALSEDS